MASSPRLAATSSMPSASAMADSASPCSSASITISSNSAASSASALSPASAMREARLASSSVEKRTAPAMVWRWRKRLLVGHQLVGMLLADFDEIAQHAIVLDLELADAAALAVLAFQPGDDAAGFIAQGAHLIQRRMRAGPDEAAIARQIRRLVHQQEFQPVGQTRHRGDVLRSASRSPPAPRRPAPACARLSRKARAAFTPSRRLARSRGPPRATDSRPSARAISGAARKASRAWRRSSESLAKASTASCRARIAFTSVSGAASRAASSRAPDAVTVRSIPASSEPLRWPDRVWVSSRLRRVAASMPMKCDGDTRAIRCSATLAPFCVSSR